MGRYRVILCGVGAIGSQVARLLAARPELTIVAAVEADPAKIGRDLGVVAGLGRELGVPVRGEEALALEAEVVLQATGSRLEEVYPQLVAALEGGKNVVSSCEELAYPWQDHQELAARLDGLARQRGVTLLSTGVNPGFVMDILPLVLAAACWEVRRVAVRRVVDLATRRLPLQRKMGAGLSLAEFRRQADQGTLGHVGLRQSAAMMAAALGWRLGEVAESLEPVLAPAQDRVLGLRQTLRGSAGGQELLRLELEIALGAPEPGDSITIDGTPPITVAIPGSVHGDLATAALMVNAIPAVAGRAAGPGGLGRKVAAPGLITPGHLPLVPALALRSFP